MFKSTTISTKQFLLQSIRLYKAPALKTGPKILSVYPPREQPPHLNAFKTYQDFVAKDLERLDPTRWRRDIISRTSPNRLMTGDIVRVVYNKKDSKNDDFMGYILGINRSGLTPQGSSILLRNHISKTSVELRVPVFSPLIERIDLIKRPSENKRKRNKHYYIRGTKLDVGDLEANLRKKK
ncbi:mitochondrial 54S ribosomal protein bL19m SCDLUD_001214 [Saccharomycodes ludwigii]|uniref:mitochondrial 54S ribosomal protein bL19m n=1 Tax=Saccharomycodes ludwigii TaxID=36035 RepID=UPI001E89EAC6|nr:hypothetical protein SCDLUD_001214 [Saccharomycodes ludwigii]KAH3903572.1 hypothetical protein SCDLUD_001214 [Saccharomycodes ludwigii]